MMRFRIIMFSLGFLFIAATAAMAQFPIIDAEQLKSWAHGRQKAVLIDVRPAEEYQQAHIPGAINIPADRMKAEASRLPKDKAAPIIFYCRGEG
ncbi:MAG: rhodanese-like domain-containing protein [Betaproteobacteria bacterium]